MDQFLQVRCKFQLTSETDSSESVHTNNERIRLSSTVDLDKNSTLIVMICSNDIGNNHVVAYYIERTYLTTTTAPSVNEYNKNNNDSDIINNNIVTNVHHPPSGATTALTISTPPKPRIIVKQIYYHHYNEDIVAISMSKTGNKLAMISTSSTIYLLPIKNILLNLHAKQPRTSQGKSMYFYDASILDCCTIENPISILCWEDDSGESTLIIVASQDGHLGIVNVDEKKQIHATHVQERIKSLSLIRDRFTYSLLIDCDNFKQFRLPLSILKNENDNQDHDSAVQEPPSSPKMEKVPQNLRSLQQQQQQQNHSDDYIPIEKDLILPLESEPILIKLHSNSSFGANNISSPTSIAVAAIQRVFSHGSRSNAHQKNIFSALNSRERSASSVFYHPSSDLVSVVEVLGGHKSQSNQKLESRLFRFYHAKHFYYRPQRPAFTCKLNCLDHDELVTKVLITDRFLVIATDRHRCLINSRNCCNVRSSNRSIDMDPVVKEIKFANEEKILCLIKSPIGNDRDEIIDSFLLVTDRCIYSIEARQSCRDMFINLMDANLGIKKNHRRSKKASIDSSITPNFQFSEFNMIYGYHSQRRRSEADNIMVNNFLSHKDGIYDKITYDSRAFSLLFKLDLNSLFEAYGDKLLLRGEFSMANRFFQMAKFDHVEILGKYVRLGAHHKALNYATTILSDENIVLDEKERMDLSKAASECLLPALKQLDVLRELVISHHSDRSSSVEGNDFNGVSSIFTESHKQSVEKIFLKYLKASLDDSPSDPCRLWSNYANFYLNHVGTIDELKLSILSLPEHCPTDCRLIIFLFKTIERDQKKANHRQSSSKFLKLLSANRDSDMLQSMYQKVYHLHELFDNVFLMKLLEKTLSLLPKSEDLNALSDCLGIPYEEKSNRPNLLFKEM